MKRICNRYETVRNRSRETVQCCSHMPILYNLTPPFFSVPAANTRYAPRPLFQPADVPSFSYTFLVITIDPKVP